MNRDLIQIFKKLNRQSQELLDSLNTGKFSLNQISESMDNRQNTIETLDKELNRDFDKPFSAEEKEVINSLFGEFETVSLEIQQKIDHSITESQKKVAAATKQRKAEDGYQLLGTPDNSYLIKG